MRGGGGRPANVADSRVLPDLLHGDETRVWGDQAYRRQGRVLEECAPRARLTCQRYHYKDRVDEVSGRRTPRQGAVEVEHVFAVMKLKFGVCEKCATRGIAKERRTGCLRTWRAGKPVSGRARHCWG